MWWYHIIIALSKQRDNLKQTKEAIRARSQMELSKPFPRERLGVKEEVVARVLSSETYFRQRITVHGSRIYEDRGKVCMWLYRIKTWIEKAEWGLVTCTWSWRGHISFSLFLARHLSLETWVPSSIRQGNQVTTTLFSSVLSSPSKSRNMSFV